MYSMAQSHKPFFMKLTKSATYCKCILIINILMCVTSQKIQQNSNENRTREFLCSKNRLPHLQFQLCMNNYCVHAQTPKLAHGNRKSYTQVEQLRDPLTNLHAKLSSALSDLLFFSSKRLGGGVVYDALGGWFSGFIHACMSSPAAFSCRLVEEEASLRMRSSRIIRWEQVARYTLRNNKTEKKCGKKKKLYLHSGKCHLSMSAGTRRERCIWSRQKTGLSWLDQWNLLKWTIRKFGLWDCPWGCDRLYVTVSTYLKGIFRFSLTFSFSFPPFFVSFLFFHLKCG